MSHSPSSFRPSPARGRRGPLLLGAGTALGLALGLSLGAGSGRASPPSAGAPSGAILPPSVREGRSAARRALADAVTIEGAGIYGAGVLVVPADGLVITAGHVVEEMPRPEVSFPDGARFVAKVLERDKGLDLALLEIPPQPDRPAPALGALDAIAPGDEVYAIGCPRHLPFTVSRGVVSYVGRSMDGARWLQTDIPINDGNSGGPVVDGDGRLVAITSFILRRAQGLSFALPVGYAVERFARLRPLLASTDLAQFQKWRGPLPPQ